MLRKYVAYFQKLRRDKKNGGAPHKPILLLSIAAMYARNELKDNEIAVSAELVSYFKTFWSQLVTTQHDPNFALPFYHMKSEPFWHLKPKPGYESWVDSKNSIRSLKNLDEAIDYARIDADLASLLLNEESRALLSTSLLDTYFPDKVESIIHTDFENNIIKQLESEILYEPTEIYKSKIAQLKKTLNLEQFEEEVFMRGNVFKREIPKLYNYSCCVSEMRISVLGNISMVDACHIVPFSESYDDTISNGFSLCPNLHRAFDRGIISVDENYRVLVSDSFNENLESTYSIRQFEGKKILLPHDSKLHPNLDNFAAHRKRHKFD